MCQYIPIPLPRLKHNGMRTFVLGWNPSLSSYKLVDFQHDFPQMEYGEFSWKVEEWQRARSGDNFYLLKWGAGNCGLVMKGFFLSDPYLGKDWDNDGQEAHYVRIRPTFMVHPDGPKGILSLGDLCAALPEYDWRCGAYGGVLSEDLSVRLLSLWTDYTSRFCPADYDSILVDRDRRPEAGMEDALLLACQTLYDKKDGNGEPLILDALKRGLSATSELERMRGFLDGIIGSDGWDAGALRDRGFPETLIDKMFYICN